MKCRQIISLVRSNEKYPWQNRGTGVRCHGYLGTLRYNDRSMRPALLGELFVLDLVIDLQRGPHRIEHLLMLLAIVVLDEAAILW